MPNASAIKLHQLYKSRRSSMVLEIVGFKKSGKYQARILTDKYGVYAGTHTLTRYTIAKGYMLLDIKAQAYATRQ